MQLSPNVVKWAECELLHRKTPMIINGKIEHICQECKADLHMEKIMISKDDLLEILKDWDEDLVHSCPKEAGWFIENIFTRKMTEHSAFINQKHSSLDNLGKKI
jgi:hypothetical protein